MEAALRQIPEQDVLRPQLQTLQCGEEEITERSPPTAVGHPSPQRAVSQREVFVALPHSPGHRGSTEAAGPQGTVIVSLVRSLEPRDAQ